MRNTFNKKRILVIVSIVWIGIFFGNSCIPKLNQSIADLGLAAYLSKTLSISSISPNQSNAEIPIFTPPAGIYTTDQMIALNTATVGATIYYTLDGTTPTSSSTVYTEVIPITGNGTSQTINAIATKAGIAESQIGRASYLIHYNAIATPTFTPPAGTYTTDQTITLNTTTEGATIYYTLDGTTPTSSSTVYKVAIPITGNGTSQTIKAIAIKAEVSSQIGLALYKISTLTNFSTTTNTSGVTNFPLSGPFVFDFSEAIDVGSIVVNSTIGSTSCTGSVQVSQDNFATCISLKAPTLGNGGKQLIVTPLPFMRPLQTYKVRITTALKSFQGVNLGAEFTTDSYTTKDVGKWVFVAGFNGNIHYCTLNQTNGTLGTVTSVAASVNTGFIALEPSGKFVFAHPNNSTPLFYASINQTTGAIPAPSSVANVANVANGGLAYHPTLPILYATAASQIRPFSINTVSGLPTVGSVLPGGTANNIGIVIHPSAKFLYWGTSGSGNSVYSAQIATDMET